MGTRRKYTEELLSDAVRASTSVAGVLRHLGVRPTGGSHAHISRTIKAFGIDTSHFRLYNPTSHSSRRLTPEQILVRSADGARRASPPKLTRALIESGVAYECGLCGCDGTWLGMPLTLEVDHVDGDYCNIVIDNLRFLCPNCHRQTPNFAGRSRGKFSGHAAALRAMGIDS
ncbi:hypothetical protein [Nocardioides zeicaulis]|uniref:HNH endonuclease n=1 Tax=Nocardioides zeicaulis TaxID=1776857 RepID=A0ABV6DY89_9ACTN